MSVICPVLSHLCHSPEAPGGWGKVRQKDSRKGNKKPSVPMEKLSTGGTAPWLKRDAACNIVPSPPSVITRSTGAAFGPADITRFPDSRVPIRNLMWKTRRLWVARTWSPHLHVCWPIRPVFCIDLDIRVYFSDVSALGCDLVWVWV